MAFSSFELVLSSASALVGQQDGLLVCNSNLYQLSPEVYFVDPFWATVTSNGLLYSTGPLSCLSVTLVHYGQTVGWIKMPLGVEVGLDSSNIVLDGDATPPQKGAQQPPTFRPMSIVVKRLDGSRCHLVQR